MHKDKGTENKTTKKLLVIASALLITFGAVSGGLIYTQYSHGHFTELSFRQTKLEYGETVDFNQLCKTEGIKLLKNNYKNNKLGKQEVKFVVQQGENRFDKTYDFTVVDTKAPVIKLKEEKVTITEGDSINLQSNIQSCTDNTGEKLEPKFEGKVDTEKAGTYEISVSVIDKSKNKTTVKFTVEVKEKQEEKKETTTSSSGKQQSSNTSTGYVASGKKHWVNPGAIVGFVPRMPGKYYEVVNGLRNGQREFYFANENEWNIVMGDIMYDYLGSSDGLVMYCESTENGELYSFADEDFASISQLVANAEVNWQSYTNNVVAALNSMNLNCSDYEMVNQINQYLVNRFSYVVTNAPLYDFTQRNIGQCYHYASMFRDMCLAVGIPCDYVSGDNHAWNVLTVDGIRYKFDSTWNDTTGSNSYSWIRI